MTDQARSPASVNPAIENADVRRTPIKSSIPALASAVSTHTRRTSLIAAAPWNLGVRRKMPRSWVRPRRQASAMTQERLRFTRNAARARAGLTPVVARRAHK